MLWEYRAWRGGKPPCWPRYAFFSGKNNFRGRKAILRAKRRVGALFLHVRNYYLLEEFWRKLNPIRKFSISVTIVTVVTIVTIKMELSLPSASLYLEVTIYINIYIYIFIYIVNIINIYSTLLYPSVFIVIIVTIVTAVGGA